MGRLAVSGREFEDAVAEVGGVVTDAVVAVAVVDVDILIDGEVVEELADVVVGTTAG